MSSMGTKIEQFDVPVCNSFKAKILNDQLCYEVDPNKFMNSENIGIHLRTGLTFLVDYNEDRQVVDEDSNVIKNAYNLIGKFEKSMDDRKMMIFVSTIGS